MDQEDTPPEKAFMNGKLNGNGTTPLMNGAKRRDRHDIVVDILKTARGGIKRTNLMHKAKLSHTQLKLYLYVLNENGLLDSNDGLVKTTSKGIQFVKIFESLNFFIFP
jgi:predicted transcriptional regulator